MRSPVGALLAVMALVPLSGCVQTTYTTDLRYQRGVEMLAAGSPRSAIPFLRQAVLSAPASPEPHAMLALAYALDLQSEQAMAQVGCVRRPKGSAPGWEGVAAGITAATQHRPSEAVACLEQAVRTTPEGSPIASAARQWLTLALLLKSDRAGALASVDELAEDEQTRTTALLWAVLIHAQQGRRSQAVEELKQAAGGVAVAGPPFREEETATADDQRLYDAAVDAVAKGNLAAGKKFLNVLEQRSPDACDAPVWLALITAAEGDWQAARAGLADACESGSARSRGLANSLAGVVCALEGRPDAMVQSMVAGQRLLARGNGQGNLVYHPAASD